MTERRPGSALLRAWALFLGALGGLLLALQWADRWVQTDLVGWNARATAALLSLAGAGATAHGGRVLSDLAPIQVIGECTAAHLIAIFVAAVLATPCRWRAKVAGITAGVPALLLLNLVRLASLAWIGRWWPGSLDTAHWLVWQSALLFATLLLWVTWASFLAGGADGARTA